MRGKLALLAGVGIGYVLGTRAGRERYEDIKVWTRKFWHSPNVQRQVHDAGEFAKDKAPDLAQFLADGAKKVMSRSGKTTKPADESASPGTATPFATEADE